MSGKYVRLLSVAALPLLAGSWMAAAGAAEGPRYTYAGAAYEWTDVKYAVKQEGATHTGVDLEGSLGLLDWLHVYGGYFNGSLDGGDIDNKDMTGYHLGAGINYGITDTIDVVGRVAWTHAELDNTSDDGYILQASVEDVISENAEIEAGFRYTEIGGSSSISNNDVFLALNYNLTDQLTLRASGIVFDDDTGFELGVRWYFGKMLGRDAIF